MAYTGLAVFGGWIRLSPESVLYSNTGTIKVAGAGDRDRRTLPFSFRSSHRARDTACPPGLSSGPTGAPPGKELLNFTWGWSHPPLKSCPILSAAGQLVTDSKAASPRQKHWKEEVWWQESILGHVRLQRPLLQHRLLLPSLFFSKRLMCNKGRVFYIVLSFGKL